MSKTCGSCKVMNCKILNAIVKIGDVEIVNFGCNKHESIEKTASGITNEQIQESNERAAVILEQEGSGYAVTCYCDGDEFVDPTTKQLWNKAGDALRELEMHLEENT